MGFQFPILLNGLHSITILTYWTLKFSPVWPEGVLHTGFHSLLSTPSFLEHLFIVFGVGSFWSFPCSSPGGISSRDTGSFYWRMVLGRPELSPSCAQRYFSVSALGCSQWSEGWAHPRRGRGWLRGPARPLACGAISPASPSLQFPSPQADFCFQASVLRCLAFW